MVKEIIGRGTWIDKVAWEVVQREERLGRKVDVYRTEMGIGASGIPHLGSLGDAVRAHAVKLALEDMGYKAEMIAYSDDMDGLRRVPAGLPEWLEEHLGKPVSHIPDPWKCHESYGEHMGSLLLEAMDACGLEYKFMSAKDVYRRGVLREQIERILANASVVGGIVRDVTGSEKYLHALPYFAICENCGRIYTTTVYEFLPDERKVLYRCEGMEVKGRWLEGCGHEGEADYTRGEGKLSWVAGEFAARWAALRINFEAYGKDIADSVRTNDRICLEVLGYHPPYHVRYEMFLDKSGRKISKSRGNVLTPQLWLRYGPPQTLLLLMLKRFVGTRRLDIMDVPRYVDELDALEDVYFGRRRVGDEMEAAKLRGLYEYVWNLNPPKEPGIHVPYNLLTYLIKAAPKGKEFEFVIEKLRAYGYLKGEEVPERLKERIQYAMNWVRDFAEISEAKVELNQKEREAIKELIQFLKEERTADEVQTAIFQIARKHEIKPGSFFRKLYQILLGMPHGPRLGPYMVAMGLENVAHALSRAVSRG